MKTLYLLFILVIGAVIYSVIMGSIIRYYFIGSTTMILFGLLASVLGAMPIIYLLDKHLKGLEKQTWKMQRFQE